MGLYDKLLKSFTNSFDNRTSNEVDEMRKEQMVNNSKSAMEGELEFCKTPFGRRCANWLQGELKKNGPVNWSALGQIHFLPQGISVGTWLKELDFVNAVPKGGGKDYCELRELSPDSRPMRTSFKIIPPWMSRGDDAKETNFQSLQGLSRPVHYFFVGVVRSNRTALGFRDECVVSDAVAPKDCSVADIQLPPRIAALLCDGEFVVGLNGSKYGPFVFLNQESKSAVQVVSWSSFEEAKDEMSACQYFEQHPNGQLAAAFPFLIGNQDRPGQVVIRDTSGTFLKGFLSVGGGKIRYSHVEIFDGNFNKVYVDNQGMSFKYEGNEFAILVPQKGNPYAEQGKHSVLDCEGWEPLESAKGKTGGDDSLVQKEEEVSPLVVGDGRHDESVTPSEGEVVGGAVAGADGSDDSVSGESLLCQQGERVTVSSTAQKKSSLDEVGHIVSNERTSSAMDERDTSELAFLDWFKAYVKRCGFVFEDRDLVRFHTSVKAGMCTLLAGDPGSGKSSLAELYSRALAGKGNEELAFRNGFCRVDVNPSWMEPADLLGYYEGDGAFKPAINGLYGYLREVQGGANMAMVCMEEINLARVEHYFSDFIQLFSRGYGHEIKGYDVKDKGGLLVGDNVLFVGTCNADESTQMMSNRFYDRVNLLEFHIDVEKAKSLLATAFAGTVAQIKPYEEGERISQDRYRSWSSLDWRPTIPSQVLKAFEALAEKLEAAELMPSGRVIGEMSRYIRLRPMYGCATDDERQMCALDEQIAQRVLARTQIGPNTSAVLKGLSEDLAEKGLKLSAKMLKFKVNAYERMISF